MMLERRQGSPATLLALDERNRLLREAALNGAVPTGTSFKRVRFRLGNVQIGGNALLEVFLLSTGLIPGRSEKSTSSIG